MTSSLRILSAGTDSLFASVKSATREDRMAELLRRKEEARASEHGTVPYDVPQPDRTFLLRGHGWRRYPAWLSSPAVEVMAGATDPHPPLYLQLHSAFLHQAGAEQAVAEAELVAEHFCHMPQATHGADEPPGRRLTISRIDVYADTQGWRPRLRDEDRFVCRGRKNACYFDPGGDVRNTGRRFTGFSWGRGSALSARVYDKTEELRVRRQVWPELIWQDRDPRLPVWRVEFQFRRQVLREIRPRDGERIDTVADALAMRQALWTYGLTWLSLRLRGVDSNRSRWPEDPLWDRLRDAEIGSPASEWIREQVKGATWQRLIEGFAGYASSLAAIAGHRGSLHELLEGMQPITTNYLQAKGRTFEQVAAMKRERSLGI